MTSSEELVCRTCGSRKYVTSQSGPHTKASCAECGSYIKFIAQPIDWDAIDLAEEKIPAGKHKGKSYQQVSQEDPGYIRWMAENMKGRPGQIADHAIAEYGL